MDKQKLYAEIEIAAELFEKTKDFDWSSRRRVVQFLENAWNEEERAREMVAKSEYIKTYEVSAPFPGAGRKI